MIESYEKDVIAADGSVLHCCYRLVVRGDSCDVYDMRRIGSSDNPIYYCNGVFTALTQGRFEEIKNNRGVTDTVRIGRVWIGETGEWNVDRNPHERDTNVPINACLRLLGYPRKETP